MTSPEFKAKWIGYFQSEGIFIDKMSGPNEERRQFENDLDDFWQEAYNAGVNDESQVQVNLKS